jgi:hypothetical protein
MGTESGAPPGIPRGAIWRAVGLRLGWPQVRRAPAAGTIVP